MANKKRKCRECKEYELVEVGIKVPLGFFCSAECAAKHGRSRHQKQQVVKQKKEYRDAKEGVKTLSTHKKEAEVAFRRYIRARDRLFYLKQGRLPECISCGTTKPGIQYAAGHFKTKGAFPELRFDEKNAYLQCNKYCNESLSGNITGTKTTRGYTEGLKVRFGEEEGQAIIEYLNSPHLIQKWTIDDLKDLKKDFNRRANEIEKTLL